ncbi:hypothetical protein TYRP_019471 [Tyrophagus putrescentiae]|nr:hypothetical protein TYRP_019471 [Tyrophagus putrescentiae]
MKTVDACRFFLTPLMRPTPPIFGS